MPTADEARYTKTCENCESETYQWERCHVCGHIPWKEEDDE